MKYALQSTDRRPVLDLHICKLGLLLKHCKTSDWMPFVALHNQCLLLFCLYTRQQHYYTGNLQSFLKALELAIQLEYNNPSNANKSTINYKKVMLSQEYCAMLHVIHTPSTPIRSGIIGWSGRCLGWMDGWLGSNGILSTPVAAISCLRSV